MENKEIAVTVGGVALVVAAIAGVVWFRSKKQTDAIHEAGKACVDKIYQDMDRAMAAHVDEMVRLEVERLNSATRYKDVMEALAVAREEGEDLHLAHLEIIADLASRKITAKDAADCIRALKTKEELVPA